MSLIDKKDGTAYRILVAEDKEINQVMAVNLLKNLGCEVDLAKDGVQAVKMAKDVKYDLIFMDCEMPILDGYYATVQIREFESSSQVIKKRTPIVALTAKVMSNDRKKCMDSGMNDYVAKPIIESAIVSVINKWCAQVIDSRSDW